MNKNELRKKYLELRKNIIDRKQKEEEIFNKLINSFEYNSSRVIALYYSLKSETDTIKLIEYSLKNKKIVLLPRVNGDDMDFYEINSLDHLVKSRFGVMEPLETLPFDKKEIDLIVVPGVCFDKMLNRIGFGKGYYDKYLSDYHKESIGICFEEQITSEIKSEKTDIKLKKIITDKNIYSWYNRFVQIDDWRRLWYLRKLDLK